MYFCRQHLRPYGTCHPEYQYKSRYFTCKRHSVFKNVAYVYFHYNLKVSGYPVRNCVLLMNEDGLYKLKHGFAFVFQSFGSLWPLKHICVLIPQTLMPGVCWV